MLFKIYKKGQGAVEFLILTGAIVFLFTLFFISLNENLRDKMVEKKNIEIKEIATSVRDEINLALKSSDGYSRQFKVPYDIDGEDYDINITGEMVYVKTSDNKYAIAIPVPSVTGDVKKGDNLILKRNGAIKINTNFQIASDFSFGGYIPNNYSCIDYGGENVNPPLYISGTPKGTESLALIVDDPDAPGGTWIHWLVWNISANTSNIPKNSKPIGAVIGLNSDMINDYEGMCPPSGTHRYYFKIYALDKNILLIPDSNSTALEDAMNGHILDKNYLMGRYTTP